MPASAVVLRRPGCPIDRCGKCWRPLSARRALLSSDDLKTPGRKIVVRLGTTGEMAGMDHELHGEHGYGLLNLN